MNNQNVKSNASKQNELAPAAKTQSQLLKNFPNYVVGYICNHFPDHYCLIPNVCCNKIYPCHYCHDEEENHTYERISGERYYCTNCDQWNDMTGIPHGEYIDCLDCKYCGVMLLSG
jgi:hypothetical protein